LIWWCYKVEYAMEAIKVSICASIILFTIANM
jgi:hypothetical protein